MSTVAPEPPTTAGSDRINNLIGELVQKIEEEFELQDFLEGQVRELSMELTPAGTLMLLLPLHDLNERELSRTDVVNAPDKIVLDRDEFQTSLQALLSTIAENPAPADTEVTQGQPPTTEEGVGRFRSAISVIHGYWKKYCEIPPFCGRRNR